MALPRYVALKSNYNGKYLRYIDENEQVVGFLQFSGDEASSPYAKLEVVQAGEGLVHLKCCYNGKYLTRWSESHWWIVAGADAPEEDRSKWSCTLFRPDFTGDPQSLRFLHVQLGHYACLRRCEQPFTDCLYGGSPRYDQDQCDVCTFVDFYNVTEIQAWGGLGGSGWRFLPQGNGGITDIIIRSGLAVDSISFVAQDRRGNRTYSSDNFGGHGGSEEKIILDWPREYLTSISGTVGDLYGIRIIKSLEFSTNHGWKHGPFGSSCDNDTAFNFSTINGSAIVGFHGHCGVLLDSIGVYVRPTPSILNSLIRKFGIKTLYRWSLMGSKLKWTFLLWNLSLEILSAYCDQISSPTKPRYALVAVIVSFVALVICLVEFGLKAIRNLLRQNNGLTYQSLIKDKPLESFLDNFGFLCTILQCVTSSVQYAYFKRHQENPLKLSFFPLLLAIYVICTPFM